MVFGNREEAGLLLAQKISKLNIPKKNLVVSGIPRGGIVVGRAISQALGVPLTAMIIKKLGAPANAELAIGAVSSSGKPVLDWWLIGDLKVSKSYLQKEIKKKQEEAQKRENFLGLASLKARFKGMVVLLVDDGLATGQTAKAAAKVLKEVGVKKLILATPCASDFAVNLVKDDFAKIIVLVKDPQFMAVGQYFRDFREVAEEEVKVILQSARGNI